MNDMILWKTRKCIISESEFYKDSGNIENEWNIIGREMKVEI